MRLTLESRPTTDQFAMLIEAPGTLGKKAWVEGQFTFGSAKPERDRVTVERGVRNGSIIYQVNLKRTELNSAGAVGQFSVRAKSPDVGLDLSIQGLDMAISSLDACSSDLLKKWGYPTEFQRQLSSYSRPERPLSAYATSNDYPRSAIDSGAAGEAHVLVDAGVNGRASNCRVVRSSGSNDIDAMTCKIATQRARYEPGSDLNGVLSLHLRT